MVLSKIPDIQTFDEQLQYVGIPSLRKEIGLVGSLGHTRGSYALAASTEVIFGQRGLLKRHAAVSEHEAAHALRSFVLIII